MKTAKKRKFFAALVALMLAVILPLSAMAETASDPPEGTPPAGDLPAWDGEGEAPAGMPGSMMGGMGIRVDTSTLTDEQKTAYEAALAAYNLTEDEVLESLVTAGAVTVDEVDAYKAQRDNGEEQAQVSGEQTLWQKLMSGEQTDAVTQATQAMDEARTTMMNALTEAGIELFSPGQGGRPDVQADPADKQQ